jgi:ABC-type multidrug transport system ATPase subunit
MITSTETALLEVKSLEKYYYRGHFNKTPTFSLKADFSVKKSEIIGVMGPNGSGKTTLFELITGSNQPSRGQVICNGQNVHNVRYSERDRLAIHYHQSYQVRNFRRRKPAFLMQKANSDYPLVHLFDEPQFNTQDGYIGFMLDFFRKLRSENRVVFVCMHPNEPFHIDILKDVCERFLFIRNGKLSQAENLNQLLEDKAAKEYLGKLVKYV